MAIKLSKKQAAEKEGILVELQAAEAKLDEAVAEYNAKLALLFADVESALGDYNAVVTRANAFMDGCASDWRSEHDEKSDKWQDGEKGQAASEFIDAWGEELPEVELSQPDELEEPEHVSDQFEQLPEEPDEV